MKKLWSLVERPKNCSAIKTRWVYKNELNNEGKVIRNKEKLVAQGYSQQKGIDYDKTFAPVSRLESICILLVFSFKCFKLYQMDIKNAFLNEIIHEEFL